MKEYFVREEFQCSCCGEEQMDETFLRTLNKARGLGDVPYTITSGYRCESHNAAVGGATHSAHKSGHGVDISCSSTANRFIIIANLLACGFNRIGVSNNFIHVDDDPSLPCNVMWTY